MQRHGCAARAHAPAQAGVVGCRVLRRTGRTAPAWPGLHCRHPRETRTHTTRHWAAACGARPPPTQLGGMAARQAQEWVAALHDTLDNHPCPARSSLFPRLPHSMLQDTGRGGRRAVTPDHTDTSDERPTLASTRATNAMQHTPPQCQSTRPAMTRSTRTSHRHPYTSPRFGN